MTKVIKAFDTQALKMVKDWADAQPDIKDKYFFIEGFNNQHQLTGVARGNFGTVLDRCRWIRNEETRKKESWNNYDKNSKSNCKGWSMKDIRTVIIMTCDKQMADEMYSHKKPMVEESNYFGKEVPQSPQMRIFGKFRLGFDSHKYFSEMRRFARYQEAHNV